MRTIVDHRVMFLLGEGDEQPVVPMTDKGWARLHGVTVHLHDDRVPQISAGGMRCRKNGEPDRRMGNIYVSVELPDPDEWTARALEAIRQ